MRKAKCMAWFLLAALAASVARAGDSAAFLLDTRSGTRVAREVERIAYSTVWDNGSSVRVAVDGVTLLEVGVPASGVVLWNAAEAGPGLHTLTHTSGDTTLTATFTVQSAGIVRLHRNAWRKDRDEPVTVEVPFVFGEDKTLPSNPFQREECRFYGWTVGTADYRCEEGDHAGNRLIEDGSVWKPTDADWEAWRDRGWVKLEDGKQVVDLYAVWGRRTRLVFYNRSGMTDDYLSPQSLADHVQGRYDETASAIRDGDVVDLLPGWHSLSVAVDDEGAPYAATWSASTDAGLEWTATGGQDATLECNTGDRFYFRIPGEYEGPEYGGEEPDENLPIQVWLNPAGEKSGKVWFACNAQMSAMQQEKCQDFPPFDVAKVEIRIQRMKSETAPDGGWLAVDYYEVCPLPPGTYRADIRYVETCWRVNMEATSLPHESQGTVFHFTVEEGGEKEIPIVFTPFGGSGGLFYRVLFDANDGTASETEWWWWVLESSEEPGGWIEGTYIRDDGLPEARREGGWMFAGWYTGGVVMDIQRLQLWMRMNPMNRTLEAHWKPINPGYVAWAESLGLSDAALPSEEDSDKDGYSNWQEYIAGTHPKDAKNLLRADLRWQSGQAVVAPAVPVPDTGRKVHVQGKKLMMDADWTDVTDIEDVEAEGWHFFRVGVELAE